MDATHFEPVEIAYRLPGLGKHHWARVVVKTEAAYAKKIEMLNARGAEIRTRVMDTDLVLVGRI